jgi:hypothetical protein
MKVITTAPDPVPQGCVVGLAGLKEHFVPVTVSAH